jgi:hypothetical protein
MANTLIPRHRSYQCLSTDTKPLDVDIGSRLFESDTGITYEFDGTGWKQNRAIPEKTEGGERKVIISDWDVQELLIEILTELKKIEYHLSIATDTNLND